MGSELKPCPFCGGRASKDPAAEWVQCEECGATGAAWQGQKEAIEAWNRRALSAQQPEAVAWQRREDGGDWGLITKEQYHAASRAAEKYPLNAHYSLRALVTHPAPAAGGVTDEMVEAACARFFGPSGAKGFPVNEMRAALAAALQVKP